jgi:anti-sigma B factor antagonist
VDDRPKARAEEQSGRITVHREADGHVLHLSGDVDALVLDKLTSDHGLNELRIVAIDVGELRYIDSTALTFLVRWAQDVRRHGRAAEIRRTTKRFERVLEVAGLTPLFVVN